MLELYNEGSVRSKSTKMGTKILVMTKGGSILIFVFNTEFVSDNVSNDGKGRGREEEICLWNH